jgi:hypothetical protein
VVVGLKLSERVEDDSPLECDRASDLRLPRAKRSCASGEGQKEQYNT